MRQGASRQPGSRVRRASGLAAGGLLWVATATAPAASPPPSISLAAAPAEVRSGASTRLSGTLLSGGGLALAGAPVELQADPFPYRGFFDAGHAVSGADGRFAFGRIRPDRNTRYRVRGGGRITPPVAVYVDAPGILHSYDRGPGRAVLTLLCRHSGYFRWIGVKVYWYVAARGSPSFRLAAITRSRELKPGVTYATATVDPPAARFVYRACLNGAGEAGVGPPGTHARCPPGDFRLRPPARR